MDWSPRRPSFFDRPDLQTGSSTPATIKYRHFQQGNFVISNKQKSPFQTHPESLLSEMLPRAGQILVTEALADTRVVLLMGARQVGKSTLAQQIVHSGYPASVVNLDEQAQREAALADPEAFVAGLPRPVMIDEVQRGGPDLFLAIKSIVDVDRSPGQFLLTGSANVLRSRRVYEALTGRIEIIKLGPLTQAEIEGSTHNFVDALFAGEPPPVEGAPKGREALIERLSPGGYPEARLRSPKRRKRWFDNYLQTTLERDLRDISHAHKLNEMPRLLRLVASQSANLFKARSLSSKLGISRDTVENYVSLLEAIFLVQRLRAWAPGIGLREVHHPKIYINDTGLLLHLLGAGEKRLRDDDQVTGKAVENFVAMEVLRHADASEANPGVFHYRRDRDELDLVLENRAGEVCAIEVKSSATIRERDWAALQRLREARSKLFRCGVLFYTGSRTVTLSDRVYAVPLSGLWTPD